MLRSSLVSGFQTPRTSCSKLLIRPPPAPGVMWFIDIQSVQSHVNKHTWQHCVMHRNKTLCLVQNIHISDLWSSQWWSWPAGCPCICCEPERPLPAPSMSGSLPSSLTAPVWKAVLQHRSTPCPWGSRIPGTWGDMWPFINPTHGIFIV